MMDTTVLDTLEKKQYVYDTLLVTGWKKERLFGWLVLECVERGIDITEIDRRAFKHGYRNNVPIQAAVFGACELMAHHLRNCKCFKDFITVRDNLNIGFYKFKHRTCMIDGNSKRQSKIDSSRIAIEGAASASNKTNSSKMGGVGISKRKGCGGRAK